MAGRDTKTRFQGGVRSPPGRATGQDRRNRFRRHLAARTKHGDPRCQELGRGPAVNYPESRARAALFRADSKQLGLVRSATFELHFRSAVPIRKPAAAAAR